MLDCKKITKNKLNFNRISKMKKVQIINASFPAYADLVGQTLSVVPFCGQYLPVSEIGKKNRVLIQGSDCVVLSGIIQ
jgi:hypothetical protein